MNDKILFETENNFVKFWVYEDFCDIEYKRNLWSFFISGKFFSGRKRIYYKDVTAIQMRPVGMIFSGYLKFEYAGAPIFSHFMSLFSDSTITFKKLFTPHMEIIYEYIQQRIHDLKSTNPVSTIDTIDLDRLVDEFQKADAERIIKEKEKAEKTAKFIKFIKKALPLIISIAWLLLILYITVNVIAIGIATIAAAGIGIIILLHTILSIIGIIASSTNSLISIIRRDKITFSQQRTTNLINGIIFIISFLFPLSFFNALFFIILVNFVSPPKKLKK